MVSIALFRNRRQVSSARANQFVQRTTPVVARTEESGTTPRLQARYRLTLASDTAIQLGSAEVGMRILAGSASVIHIGQSHILTTGEERAFSGLVEGLMIRACDGEPLVVEVVLDTASDDHRLLKQQFYARMAHRLQLMDAESKKGAWGA